MGVAPLPDCHARLDHVVLQLVPRDERLHHHAAVLDVLALIAVFHAEEAHARGIGRTLHRVRLVPVGEFVNQQPPHGAGRDGYAPRLLDGDRRSLVKGGVVLAGTVGEAPVEEEHLRRHAVDLARLLGHAQNRDRGLDDAPIGHAAGRRSVAGNGNRGQHGHDADDDQQFHEREGGTPALSRVHQRHTSPPVQLSPVFEV